MPPSSSIAFTVPLQLPIPAGAAASASDADTRITTGNTSNEVQTGALS